MTTERAPPTVSHWRRHTSSPSRKATCPPRRRHVIRAASGKRRANVPLVRNSADGCREPVRTELDHDVPGVHDQPRAVHILREVRPQDRAVVDEGERTVVVKDDAQRAAGLDRKRLTRGKIRRRLDEVARDDPLAVTQACEEDPGQLPGRCAPGTGTPPRPGSSPSRSAGPVSAVWPMRPGPGTADRVRLQRMRTWRGASGAWLSSLRGGVSPRRIPQVASRVSTCL